MSKDLKSSPKRRLRTVKQFAARHQAFSEAGLRWLLFHRHENGLNQAVVQVGRRVLIDIDAFFAWLDTQQHTQDTKNDSLTKSSKLKGKVKKLKTMHN